MSTFPDRFCTRKGLYFITDLSNCLYFQTCTSAYSVLPSLDQEKTSKEQRSYCSQLKFLQDPESYFYLWSALGYCDACSVLVQFLMCDHTQAYAGNGDRLQLQIHQDPNVLCKTDCCSNFAQKKTAFSIKVLSQKLQLSSFSVT